VVQRPRKDSEHMDMALVQRIENLRRLTVAELKTKHREVFSEETRSTHKQYLFRRIAWQLQPTIRARWVRVADSEYPAPRKPP
jgi:hypothetical protein